jgi:xanthine dehydrogenase YagS FAD-binding subunit
MRAFDYARAANANDAVHSAPASFLAGGTTLIDLMKLDVMNPAQVLDINGLRPQFGQIEANEDGLHLGALVHMAEAADHLAIRSDYPVISQSLLLAASAQIRNMATLGGNVLQRTRCNYFRDTSYAHCNKRAPGSGCDAIGGVNRRHAVLGTGYNCIATYQGDFAQALIALDAVVEIAGPGRARKLPFAELHLTPEADPTRETTLLPGEMITGFFVPAGAWTKRSLYLKVRDRESYEFALASVAVALDLDDRNVRDVRVALGGLATKPWRAREAEAVLRGHTLDENSAKRAAEAAFANAVTHGLNDFKPELGRRALVRALLQAAEA